MPPVQIRPLTAADTPAAVDLLARAMRDNPINVAAFGANPQRRERRLHRMFATLFRVFDSQRPICAIQDGVLAGVAGIAGPGGCQPTGAQRARFLPTMASYGPVTASRVAGWLSGWAEHDPDEPHVHLGPVAVDPQRQRRGVGRMLMVVHCRDLDQNGQLGYLETDKAENVGFYERHGYEVVEQADVLEVPSWFMIRRSVS